MKSPLLQPSLYIATLGMMAWSLPIHADSLTVEGDLNVEGAVGIGTGTTTPTATLDVAGNAKVSGVLTATALIGDGSGLTGIMADKAQIRAENTATLDVVVLEAATGTAELALDTATNTLRRGDGSTIGGVPLRYMALDELGNGTFTAETRLIFDAGAAIQLAGGAYINLEDGAAVFFQSGANAVFNGPTGSEISWSCWVADSYEPALNANASGVLSWGSGLTATDTNLYRSAANTLKTDDAFQAASFNGNTITTGTGTLTLGAGSTLATSATHVITLTSTGATNVTLPTSGTLLATTGSGSSLTGLTKSQIGLSNVDNTSDANKPVSTAQAAADNLRALKTTTVTAGAGLTGGGDLSANCAIALSPASIASLALANAAVQGWDSLPGAVENGYGALTGLSIQTEPWGNIMLGYGRMAIDDGVTGGATYHIDGIDYYSSSLLFPSESGTLATQEWALSNDGGEITTDGSGNITAVSLNTTTVTADTIVLSAPAGDIRMGIYGNPIPE